MLMDAAKLSAAIRAKKKALKESSPEIIGTSPTPDMNAQDVMDKEQEGRIQETVGSDPKINADDAQMGMGMEAGNVGLSPEEKARMGRLRAYLDGMDFMK